MEHIEEAGIHSGDSSCVVPPPFLSDRHIATIRDYTRRIAKALKVIGLMNVQYAIKDDTVYVLEVNPRASRTVPYLSKANGVPLAQIAARVMAGKSLAELGMTDDLTPAGVFVKSPVFPFVRFPGVDTILGPEMKSTGEVMGGAGSFGMAFVKAMLGAGQRLPEDGAVCITVNNEDKGEVLPIAQGLAALGFQIIGTRGTAAYLRAHGVDCSVVFKVNEGRPSLADEIVNRKISMVINTPHGRESFFDDKAVRRAAMMAGVPCITTITGAAAALEAIRALKTEGLDVRALQDYYAAVARESITEMPPERSGGSFFNSSPRDNHAIPRDSATSRRLQQSGACLPQSSSPSPSPPVSPPASSSILNRSRPSGGRPRCSACLAFVAGARQRFSSRKVVHWRCGRRRVRAARRRRAGSRDASTAAPAARGSPRRLRHRGRSMPTRHDDPVEIEGRLMADATPSESGATLRVQVERASIGSCPEPAAGGVSLTVSGVMAAERIDEWRAGRSIRATAVLRRPARYLNDGVPDSGTDAGAARHLAGRHGEERRAGARGCRRGSWVDETAASIRAAVRRAITRHVGSRDPQSAAIAIAILIGDRGSLDPIVEQRLQEAGTYHVIAISGGNIAILAGLVLAVLWALRIRGGWAASAAIVLLAAYAFVAGGGPSVMRATRHGRHLSRPANHRSADGAAACDRADASSPCWSHRRCRSPTSACG